MIKKQDHLLIAGLGIEFAVIMCLGVFGGRYLDKIFNTSPVFLLIGGAVAFALALYVLIKTAKQAVYKDLEKNKKDVLKEETKK